MFNTIKNKIFGGGDVGETITPQGVKELTDYLNQSGYDKNGNLTLLNELNKAIGNIHNNSGLDANKIRKTACVALSLYADLKLNGIGPSSFSDFYADNVNAGNIRGKDGFVEKDKNFIVNKYGADIITVYDYDKFENLMKSGGVNYGVLRYANESNKGHNVNLYRDKGKMYISNVGHCNDHGSPWRDFLNNKLSGENKNYSFKYFQYIKKR